MLRCTCHFNHTHIKECTPQRYYDEQLSVWGSVGAWSIVSTTFVTKEDSTGKNYEEVSVCVCATVVSECEESFQFLNTGWTKIVA